MDLNQFIWNKGKTNCVRLEAIRNLTIIRKGIEEYSVLAWFSDKKTCDMGNFNSMKDAQAFVENVKNESR